MKAWIGAAWIGFMLSFGGLIEAAPVWCISEVLTGEATWPRGTLGPYVELFAPSAIAGQTFDLVVMDAGIGTGRQWTIYSVTTLTTVADADTYIVNSGSWTALTPEDDQRVAASLNYGYSFGAARTLMLYDHATGLSPGGSPQQANVLAAGPVADAVTYQISPVTGASLDGETVHTITLGEALWRVPGETGYTDNWTTGAIDFNLAFLSGEALSPGLINEMIITTTHMPEPISAAGWCLALAMWGLVRRRPAATR